MTRDSIDFLTTLLWVADNPDADNRELSGKTVHDFHPPFMMGV